MIEENGLKGKKLERALRQGVVPDLTEDGLEELERNIRRERLRRFLRVGILILVIAAVFVGYRLIRASHQYNSYSVVWESEELASAGASYAVFEGNVIRATMDGVACLDTSGNLKWSYGYSMKQPQVEVQGSYGIIADLQSNSAVIFNGAGVTGEVSTTLPILNCTVSNYGVAALILNDTNANYVTFYNNDGSALDIRIKTKLSGDGYPMDLSLSPSGTGLMESVVYVDQNQMQNQIVFYNFEVGQQDSNRIVGYYAYGSTMFPEVSYLSSTVTVAFGDNQLNLYSMKNETKPTLITSIELEGDVYSTLKSSDRVGVILQTETANRLLRVYDLSGHLKFEQEIDFNYTSAEFSNGNIVIYDDTECMIINRSGNVQYRGTLDGSIQGIISISDNSCLVVDGTSMRRLRFH